MTPLRLAVGYFHPWPNDTGWILGAADGSFRDAGVDLTISAVDPLRGDALQAVCDGAADLAVVPANRLLARRERGASVVAVAALNHVPLETIQTLASTGITRPRELVGRRLALNPTPRGLAMVRHLVAADGGDADAVQIVDSGAREWDVAGIPEGRWDASFGGYWAWDVLLAHPPRGDAHLVWPIDELGAPPFQPYLLAASEALLEHRGDLVGTLLSVAAGRFASAADERDAAHAALERAIPYFPAAALERSLELIAPTWFDAAGAWGRVDAELLASYAAWLAAAGVLQDGSSWTTAIWH